MVNLSLRGLDDETANRLKQQARYQGMSVNALVLRLIRQQVGAGPEPSVWGAHHDLDALAGTWSQEETARFMQAVADFDAIDTRLWR